MAVEYPGIALDTPDDVDMNITFYNRGRTDETVEVWAADTLKGWTTRLKTYKFTVTGVHVPAGKDKALTFEANPDDNLEPGRYQFRIAAKTRDGHLQMDETIAVTIKGKKEAEVKSSKDLELSTTYEVQAFAFAVSPGARSTVKQLQNQLKQAGYEPRPIDGILGPKTIAALQHYMEVQERALVKSVSTPSHETNGT